MITPISHIRLYALIITAVWTASMACSLVWLCHQERNNVLNIARAEARATYEKDTLYRRWASGHGGVYVPATDLTPPNPSLSHIPERDITTPSGKALTLVNPAYMTRQVFELAGQLHQFVRSHITSLKPIRPGNAPDAWEARALRDFESGVQEVSEVQIMNGHRYMRLMRPFVTEKGCLKCHASQGYKIGDIRGGVSVSVPLEALYKDMTITGGVAAHGIVWLLGIGLIGMGTRTLSRSSVALQESEERYRMVADYTANWEYWQAPDESFHYVSPSCKLVCGYTQDEFYRDPELMKNIIHPDDLHSYTTHVHATHGNGDLESIDFRIITHDGQVRWISHVCRSVFSSDGKENGRRASNRDITDRKRAEEKLAKLNDELEHRVSERTALLQQKTEELEQANERLKEVDRLKSLFLASMSHELRTPLNAVIGFSSVLLEEWLGPANAEQKQNLASILGCGRHLLDMINDILDVTQIEAGTIKPVIEEFDLFDLLAEAQSQVTATIREKGLELQSESLRQQMRTDRRRLLQCVLNILSNAAKFTDKGGVTVAARIVPFTEEAPGEEMVEIAVTDTGIGIGAEDLVRIFQPFSRIVIPHRAIVPGTGLGLFLTRKIATEILKGDLLVSSEQGKGSRFSLRIPARLS